MICCYEAVSLKRLEVRPNFLHDLLHLKVEVLSFFLHNAILCIRHSYQRHSLRHQYINYVETSECRFLRHAGTAFEHTRHDYRVNLLWKGAVDVTEQGVHPFAIEDVSEGLVGNLYI